MINLARVAWRNLSLWSGLGSNIKHIRKWRKFSDIEVSQKTEIDLKKYRRFERGNTDSISFSEIVKLIRFFEVLPEEIIPLGKIR